MSELTQEPSSASNQIREESDDNRFHRLLRLLFWAGITIVIGLILEAFGIDVIGWLKDVWSYITEISPIFIVVGITFKSFESMLTSVSWWNILRSAFPSQAIRYKTVLGAYQGGVGINQIAPAKAGTWAMFGLYHLYIPGSRFATIVSAFVVQSLSFTFFGALIWVFLFFSRQESATSQFDFLDTIESFVADYTVPALLIGAALVFLAYFMFKRYQSKLAELRGQLEAGGQILKTPKSYVVKAFLPALAAYMCRWVYTGVFMAAFDIPVTLTTIFLVIASNSVANAFAVTPGGVGETQAANVAALSDYAPADVVTAYSLAQGAIISAWNVAFAVITMSWAFGWGQTKDLIKNRKQIAANVEAEKEDEESQDQASAPDEPNENDT